MRKPMSLNRAFTHHQGAVAARRPPVSDPSATTPDAAGAANRAVGATRAGVPGGAAGPGGGHPRPRPGLRPRATALADAVGALAVVGIATYAAGSGGVARSSWAAPALALLWVLSVRVVGGYRRTTLRGGAGEAWRVLLAAGGLAAAAGAFALLTGTTLVPRPALTALAVAATTLAQRLGRRYVLGHRRRGGPSAVQAPAADRALAALTVVFLLPVLLLIGLAVKLSSRGPALVRQPRRGRHGRPVAVLRFRTTVIDGGRTAPGAPPTGIGRFLRRCSLDQLPTLVDVVRGELPLLRARYR